MNKTIRLLTAMFLGLMTFLPYKAEADTLNPSDVEMTVYGLFLSKNTDCSKPVLVLSNSSPKSQNMVKSPTFGSGAIPKGTYQCVIVAISNYITTTPATTSTASPSQPECVQGVSFTNQICRTGQSSINPTTGATITCTNGTQAEVYAYFSTTGSAANGNLPGGYFLPTYPGPLNAPVVVAGDHTLTFVTDFNGQLYDDGTSTPSSPETCRSNAPTMLTR